MSEELDDGMTDVTVKNIKSLLRTCAHVCTQEIFPGIICHIRHLSLDKGKMKRQTIELDNGNNILRQRKQYT